MVGVPIEHFKVELSANFSHYRVWLAHPAPYPKRLRPRLGCLSPNCPFLYNSAILVPWPFWSIHSLTDQSLGSGHPPQSVAPVPSSPHTAQLSLAMFTLSLSLPLPIFSLIAAINFLLHCTWEQCSKQAPQLAICPGFGLNADSNNRLFIPFINEKILTPCSVNSQQDYIWRIKMTQSSHRHGTTDC